MRETVVTKTRIRPRIAPFLLAAALVAVAAVPASGLAAGEEATSQDVEAARRCAVETRAAGYAFGEVRDSVRAGGTTRAQALLAAAEDSLHSARSACRDNAEVSLDLEVLAAEAAGLRQSLSAAPR